MDRRNAGHARSPLGCLGAALAVAGWALGLAARPAFAHASQPHQTVQLATVQGQVFDSLTATPLAGAVVQLVGLDTLATFARVHITKADGRYAFTGVPNGRFALGFYGSVADSLALGPPIRGVVVAGDAVVRADLAVPAAATMRALLCTDSTAASVGGVAIGRVREARGSGPAAGATVTASWFEFVVGEAAVSRGARTQRAMTRGNGWFVLCGLPEEGDLTVSVTRGAEDTDPIPVTMGASGLYRRDFFLGSMREVTVAAAATNGSANPDDPDGEAAVERTGDGVLRGEVRTALGDQVLPAVRVAIKDGRIGLGNDRGQFVLRDVPMGTRLLDVRALGYFPRRLAVDVIEGGAPIRVEMQLIKSVLDSVRVMAGRDWTLNLIGFNRRRASEPLGQFLTQDDVQQRPANLAADLLSSLRGVRVTRGADGRSSLAMRQTFGRRVCQPRIFIDSVEMNIGGIPLTFDDLNGFVQKDEIEGIEVYPAEHVPPQFRAFSAGGSGGCGAIILHTRVSRLAVPEPGG